MASYLTPFSAAFRPSWSAVYQKLNPSETQYNVLVPFHILLVPFICVNKHSCAGSAYLCLRIVYTHLADLFTSSGQRLRKPGCGSPCSQDNIHISSVLLSLSLQPVWGNFLSSHYLTHYNFSFNSVHVVEILILSKPEQ